MVNSIQIITFPLLIALIFLSVDTSFLASADDQGYFSGNTYGGNWKMAPNTTYKPSPPPASSTSTSTPSAQTSAQPATQSSTVNSNNMQYCFNSGGNWNAVTHTCTYNPTPTAPTPSAPTPSAPTPSAPTPSAPTPSAPTPFESQSLSSMSQSKVNAFTSHTIVSGSISLPSLSSPTQSVTPPTHCNNPINCWMDANKIQIPNTSGAPPPTISARNPTTVISICPGEVTTSDESPIIQFLGIATCIAHFGG